MIRTDSSYPKSKELEGVLLPKAKDIGKGNAEILELIRKALKDFRRSTSHVKESYLSKTSELKINYLDQLLRERLKRLDIGDSVSKVDVELTKSDIERIGKIVREQFGSVSDDVVKQVIETVMETLSSFSVINDSRTDVSKKRIESTVRIQDIDNGKFLEEYFDNLYKKSEKYQDLKTGIVEELQEHHNDTLRLFKDRVQQYKTMLLDYKKYLEKANEIIGKQNQTLKKNGQQVILGKTQEVKRRTLPEQNLLTDQIVEQIRKNEGMSKAPVAKRLGPEHMEFANNLVDKFYRNGKIELKLKKLKMTLGAFGKVMGFILTPISFAVKKMFGLVKSVTKGLAHLGRFVFEGTKNLFLAALISPGGAYTIGFIAGFVSEMLKELWGDKDEKWSVAYIFDVIYKYIIKPMINAGKVLFEVGKFVGNMIAKHPLVFGSLVLLLKGIAFTIKNFSTISKGFSIAKKGLKFAGPFILGLAASAATEAIFNNTVFKKQDENKLEYAAKINEKYSEFSNNVNQQTLKELNLQDAAKYSSLKDGMDREQRTLQELNDDLMWVSQNFKDKDDERASLVNYVGREFVEAVFTSELYGFNKEGFDRFLNDSNETTIKHQREILAQEILMRNSMLARQMGVISQASVNGHVDMVRILDDMVEEKVDEKGNILRRLRQRTEMDENGKEVQRNVVADKLRRYGEFKSEENLGYLGITETDREKAYHEYNGPNAVDWLQKESKKAEEKKSKDTAVANMRVGGGLGEKQSQEIRERSLKSNMHQLTLDRLKEYIKKNNINNAVFSQLIDKDSLRGIMRNSNNDTKKLQKDLDGYFEQVKGKYMELSQGRNKTLGDELQDMEKQILRLRKQNGELKDEIDFMQRRKTGIGNK